MKTKILDIDGRMLRTRAIKKIYQACDNDELWFYNYLNEEDATRIKNPILSCIIDLTEKQLYLHIKDAAIVYHERNRFGPFLIYRRDVLKLSRHDRLYLKDEIEKHFMETISGL